MTRPERAGSFATMPKTVLLADDSSTIRKIVEIALSEIDIRVESVRGGAEALESLSRLRPDLVLADVVMPQPDGYALCRTVKASEKPVPVVLLAGTFEPFDAERARQAGADDHLVKPFEADVLIAKVRRLLAPPEPARSVDGVPAGEPVPAPTVTRTLAVTSIAADSAPPRLSTSDLDAIAQVVLERLTSDVVREWARESLPEIAREVVRERIRELESMDDS